MKPVPKSVDSSQPLNHSSMSTKVSGLWELQLREIEDQSHKTVLRNCFGWFNSWSNDTLYRFCSMCSICFRSAQSTAGRKDQKGERRQSNSRCRRRPDARDSMFDQTLTRGRFSSQHGDTWCKDLWRLVCAAGVAFRRFAANGFYHLLAWQLFFNRNSDGTLLISSLHMMKSFFAEFSYTLQDKNFTRKAWWRRRPDLRWYCQRCQLGP